MANFVALIFFFLSELTVWTTQVQIKYISFIIFIILSFFPIPPFIFLLPFTAPITVAISSFLTTITPLISSYTTAIRIYEKIPTIIRSSLPELPTTDTAFVKFRNYILVNFVAPIIIFLGIIITTVVNDIAISNLTVKNYNDNIQAIYTTKFVMIGILSLYFIAKVVVRY